MDRIDYIFDITRKFANRNERYSFMATMKKPGGSE